MAAKTVEKKKKTKSRGNGEGTVYFNGTYWVAQITIGRDPETNRLKRKSFYDKSRKAVQSKMMNALYKVNTNSFVDPSSMPTKQWAEYWLENFKKPQVSETTCQRYQSTINTHVIQPFGNVSLKNLNTFQIQEYFNSIARNGISHGYLKQIHHDFNCILEKAVSLKLIEENPIKHVIIPKEKNNLKKGIKVLTSEEQKKLIDYCFANPSHMLFYFLLGTGMRIGEALALRWQDIDFDENKINVNHTLIKIDGQFVLKEGGKTRNSQRFVPMTPKIRKWLEEQQEQVKNRKKEDLLFSVKGNFMNVNNIERHLKKICHEINISEITPHALRHTFATRLIEAGVNVKTISELLGHSDIKITLNVYAHILENTLYKDISQLDHYL